MKQVYLESKKAHKEAIISTVCYQDANNRKLPNLMFSASEDGTIKLWDLRLNKAVKLLNDSNLKTENYSNLQLDSQNNNLYIACDEKLLAFDIKTDKILIDKSEISTISKESVSSLSLEHNYMAYVDDE